MRRTRRPCGTCWRSARPPCAAWTPPPRRPRVRPRPRWGRAATRGRPARGASPTARRRLRRHRPRRGRRRSRRRCARGWSPCRSSARPKRARPRASQSGLRRMVLLAMGQRAAAQGLGHLGTAAAARSWAGCWGGMAAAAAGPPSDTVYSPCHVTRPNPYLPAHSSSTLACTWDCPGWTTQADNCSTVQTAKDLNIPNALILYLRAFLKRPGTHIGPPRLGQHRLTPAPLHRQRTRTAPPTFLTWQHCNETSTAKNLSQGRQQHREAATAQARRRGAHILPCSSRRSSAPSASLSCRDGNCAPPAQTRQARPPPDSAPRCPPSAHAYPCPWCNRHAWSVAARHPAHLRARL